MKKKLKDQENNQEFAIMYNGHIYQMEDQKSMEAFLNNPDLFINQEFVPIENLPFALNQIQVGMTREYELQIQGYCPICLYDKNLVKGNTLILAQFNGKKWAFKDYQCRNVFLQDPWKYENVQLPKKMPAQGKQMNNKDLAEMNSYITYLEQSVGNVIMKGLAEVGRQRLCFPCLEPRETALKHLAIFLKANNPKSNQYRKDKYNNKMKEFVKLCELPNKIMKEGLRKQALEDGEGWYEWDDQFYFQLGEQFNKLLNELYTDPNYFYKFIR